MATSGSTNWTSSRNLIIENAYRLIGALGENETISATQLTLGAQFLNPMTKKFATMGMPVWAMKSVIINFSQFSTTPVSIGPSMTIDQEKPLKIVQAIRRDDLDTTDVPMDIRTWEDYNRLADKTTTGTPVQLFYHPKGYTGDLYVWQLPDSYWTTNGKLVLRYQRPFEDFDAAADEPDFPVEWHETLAFQLAVRMAPQYGLAPTDRGILIQEAAKLLKENLDFDQEEGSLFIVPDRR